MVKLSQKIKYLGKESDDTKISFMDIIYFLRSNLKFFVLSTLGLSVIAVALVLLMPKQYQKQIDLSVRQVPIGLPPGLPEGTKLDNIPTDSLGTSAVRYLQEGNLGNVKANPRYDRAIQQIDLSLSSRDRRSLDEADSKVISLLEDKLQGSYGAPRLGPVLEARQTELERDAEGKKETMAQIERQIEQTSANASARLQGLEVQRAAVLGEITLNEIEVEDLEQAQEELPQLAAGMFSVDILDESEVRESLSLVEKIAIALLSAFVLATILTFVRGAIWKKPRV